MRRVRTEDGGKPAPHGSRPSDMSPSYNKPGSIMHWVQESEEAKHVDYVLYIDADMLLRLPMDPVKMGVKPGVVVSEHVGYMDTGLRNGLQFQFLPNEQAHIAGDDVDDHRPGRAPDPAAPPSRSAVLLQGAEVLFAARELLRRHFCVVGLDLGAVDHVRDQHSAGELRSLVKRGAVLGPEKMVAARS